MKCSICGKEIEGHGHNPCPLKDSDGHYLTIKDRCCDKCNAAYVIPARFAQLCGDEEHLELINLQVNRLRGIDVKPVKGTRHLIAVIERPDGSTYQQEIHFVKNDVQKSVDRAQKELGGKYRYYIDKRGKRRRVINNRAYIIVDTFVREDK